jgi:hypothetical protein
LRTRPDAVSRTVARDRHVAKSVVVPAIWVDVEEVEVVVAHNERATHSRCIPISVGVWCECWARSKQRGNGSRLCD